MERVKCIGFNRVKKCPQAFMPCTEDAVFMRRFCERHQMIYEEMVLSLIREDYKRMSKLRLYRQRKDHP